MARENMYNPLEVYYEKVTVCPLRNRQFNFFELVYVISGIGTHTVNGNCIDYQAGDLFLLTPNDCHEFDLEGECEFMVIRFGEHYIREYQWKSIDHIECLLYYASELSESLLSNSDDVDIIAQLMQTLKQVVTQEAMYNEDIIGHLVNAVIVIAARNIAIRQIETAMTETDSKIRGILNYIQQYIREPDKLKVQEMAAYFSLAPNYLGSYFRKHCGESLQVYIAQYKIRLIEHRLRFSSMRIGEIADEFGFTDESHINKFFKRYHSVSMSVYRKQQFKERK
ncbi:AraC family transcriptional regulator [Myroides pelagicus]|nr:AraC family transcriptional regulator [Myroides pelagicus]